MSKIKFNILKLFTVSIFSKRKIMKKENNEDMHLLRSRPKKIYYFTFVLLDQFVAVVKKGSKKVQFKFLDENEISINFKLTKLSKKKFGFYYIIWPSLRELKIFESILKS